MDNLLDALPIAIVLIEDDRVVSWNRAACLLYGRPADEAVGRPVYEVLFDTDDAPVLEELFLRVRSGESWEGDFRVHGRDGAHLVSAFRLVGLSDGRLAWLAVDATDQKLAEEERAVLLSAEHAARATAEEAQHRLAVLATASSVLTSTMEVGPLLERLARVLVPGVADCCIIELIDADGALGELVVSHTDRTVADEIRAAVLKEPVGLTRGGPIADVVTSGRARLYREEDLSSALDATSRHVDQLEINRSLGLTSAILAPIEARGVVLGVLGLSVTGERELGEGDLDLAVELAHRAALAIGNARAFEQERRVAETLQRALLPSALPSFSGLDIGVRYLAAVDGVDVGGDWYDVIALTPQCVGLVIGDVVGHDVRAASAMGQVRNALRAFVIDGVLDPADAMARTDRLMDRLGLSLATGVLALLDVDTGMLRWSNAGHPAPVLISGQDVKLLEDGRRLLLGGGWPCEPRVGELRLTPGDTIVLYTDGLIERRGESILEGFERLQRAARAGSSVDAEDLCEHLIDELVPAGSGRTDDVALLVARFD